MWKVIKNRKHPKDSLGRNSYILVAPDGSYKDVGTRPQMVKDAKAYNESLRKIKNPSSLKVKAGEWIPCHAVRVKGGKLEIMKDALGNPSRKTNVGTNVLTTLNAKQDFIAHKIREKEKEIDSAELAMERVGNKITTAEKDRIYGKEFAKLKKTWQTKKKQLSALWKQSNANIRAIAKAAK